MGAKQTPGMTGNKLTKEERRSAAREKARLLREQEEKRARRNRILLIFGVLAALLLVGLVIFKIVSSGNANDTGSYDGKARSAELQNVQADFGIAVGKDGAALATPVADVPQVGVYADLMCPHCVQLEHDSKDAYEKFMPTGKVGVVHYPVEIMNTDYAKYGTAALLYVATYAPESYTKFHTELFDYAYKIIVERSAQMPTAAKIADMAKAAGVPADIVNDLPASITSEAWQKHVQAATEKFREAGWKGTPTVTVNGTETNAWGNGGMKAVFAEALGAAK
ncbi:DsbA family protein [Arcanobacterium hippocoleae]|uniref:DsbA family protein n=1 Tax=Arcanobacterium hippocoleae TaxID=149017 RepID=UPI003341E4A5